MLTATLVLPPTVFDLVRRLLPAGSRPASGGTPNWDRCPEWPPDLFAVVATLVAQSDCFTRLRGQLSGEDHDTLFKEQLENNIEDGRLGEEWARNRTVPGPLEKHGWEALIKTHGKEIVAEPSTAANRDLKPWEKVALRLLAVADEAGAEMGWAPRQKGQDGQPFAASWLLRQFRVLADKKLQQKEKLFLPHLPYSICQFIPKEIACVLPKANTPRYGATLRALSHHLALLPGVGEAEAQWVIGGGFEPSAPAANPAAAASDELGRAVPGPLNLLVIPFPFDVRGVDFEVRRPARAPRRAGIVPANTPPADPEELAGRDGLFAVKQG